MVLRCSGRTFFVFAPIADVLLDEYSLWNRLTITRSAGAMGTISSEFLQYHTLQNVWLLMTPQVSNLLITDSKRKRLLASSLPDGSVSIVGCPRGVDARQMLIAVPPIRQGQFYVPIRIM